MNHKGHKEHKGFIGLNITQLIAFVLFVVFVIQSLCGLGDSIPRLTENCWSFALQSITGALKLHAEKVQYLRLITPHEMGVRLSRRRLEEPINLNGRHSRT